MPSASLIPILREGLRLQRRHLVSRPLIGHLVRGVPTVPEGGFLGRFLGARPKSPWSELPDGTFLIRVEIDYADLWRGYEKDVMDTVVGTIDERVTALTHDQHKLLLNTPEEFFNLKPAPEQVRLLGCTKEDRGGVTVVTGLIVDKLPRGMKDVVAIGVLPNLVPIERQLSALHTIFKAAKDSELAPLRQLVGEEAELNTKTTPIPAIRGRLDGFQRNGVELALSTPHFACIQGPPGSGKTTMISAIVDAAIGRGDRVLVVSPTNAATDNVVEKFVPDEQDDLHPSSIPLRYASRKKKVASAALPYWKGAESQHRAGTVSMRLRQALEAHMPEAAELYGRLDPEKFGSAPLTNAFCQEPMLLCGTPIGLLSCQELKDAPAAGFDLLIVDEVSKLLMPEFLAIAVKAKRWVLVGDPQQLPPYNDTELNGVTLNKVLTASEELACTVGAVLEKVPPKHYDDVRKVVLCRDPELAAVAIRRQLSGFASQVPVSTLDSDCDRGIVVCDPMDLDEALERLSPVRDSVRDRGRRDVGSTEVIVERGLAVERPAVASGHRFIELRERAPARLFGESFELFNSLPWQDASGITLRTRGRRKGLRKMLPCRPDAVNAIGQRVALFSVSVYDWLVESRLDSLDVAPLTEVRAALDARWRLRAAIKPYVGVLKKQYRMKPVLSVVPRLLFYQGKALHDGLPGATGGGIALANVATPVDGETNPGEVAWIVDRLRELRDADEQVLIITPYRAQEAALNEAIAELRAEGELALDIEVCTLDRCQGREAEYVMVSLVRGRSSNFLESPKRWNVALTRAKEGLSLVGNLDAFRDEARRHKHRSLLSHIITALDGLAGVHHV